MPDHVDSQHVQQVAPTTLHPPPRELPASRVEPSFVLYQPSFPLTEADFMRLQKSSPALSAVGGTLLAFGIAFGLPGLLTTWKLPANERVWLNDELIVAVIISALGLTLTALGILFSWERFQLRKRIREHFSRNPGKHEIRGLDL